jgi:probable O-glycosylation ligase (exosortase A-associated)
MEKGLIFTYALTALGLVGSVFSPFVGLLVYVAFAILRPEHMWRWAISPDSHFSRIIGVAMLLSWAVHGFGRWRFGRAGAVVAVLLAYWVWMMVSALQAANEVAAWQLVEFHAKVILPFLVGLTTIQSVAQLKQLAWVILLCQGYLAFELNVAYLSGYNRVWEEGFGAMDNNCVAIAMVTGVGLAFFLGMGARRWWQKGIALFTAALMAHVIMMSFSRGGMLALALSGLMAFVLIPKQPRHYLAFGLAVLLAVRMAGPEVQKRFLTAFASNEAGVYEASAQSRLDLWRGALDLALGNPLFGVGPDNWGDHAPEYGWPKGKEVHSLWVQNAAELGFPGAALLLSFFLLVVVRLWPLTRESQPVSDPWLRDAARMVIASLFGFLIAAQFVTIKYLEVPFYVALIGAGALMLLEPEPATWRPALFSLGIRRRADSAPVSV